MNLDAIQKRKLRLTLRDRRKTFDCAVCGVSFKMQRLHRSPSKWCDSCRVVTLDCHACNKQFSIHRRFYEHRGAKYCSRTCSISKTKFHFERPEDTPNYKHGLAVFGKKKQYARLHRDTNRTKYRLYAMHRVARKQNAQGSYTLEQWESLKQKYDHMCLCCKRSEPLITLSADHIKPLSKGGGNDISNIQPLCMNCNSRKHTKEINYISQFYELRV